VGESERDGGGECTRKELENWDRIEEQEREEVSFAAHLWSFGVFSSCCCIFHFMFAISVLLVRFYTYFTGVSAFFLPSNKRSSNAQRLSLQLSSLSLSLATHLV